jgi:beta-glucanase (GH16 family)
VRRHPTRLLVVTATLLGASAVWFVQAASARVPLSPRPAAHVACGSAKRETGRRHRRRALRHRSIGRSTSTAASHLSWSDEFNGPAGAPPDPSKWSVIYGGGGFGNDELQYYTSNSSNLAFDGAGHLVITALSGSYTGSDGVTRSYTSGAIQTKGLFRVRYGTLEARIEIPRGQGLWPAFWAVGSDIDSVGWPQCGEIDMMENLGSDPFTVYGSIHGPQSGVADGYGITTAKRSPVSLAGGFHVYGVTWSPHKLVFTLDGAAYATYTPASLSPTQKWVFNKPFFLILNLAVGGNWPGSPNAATTFPAKMLVDWVRVYS